ncbi:MAG: hypothetical protein PVF20_08590 [Desulfobacterales bacterium]|jgi:hypothetical protein
MKKHRYVWILAVLFLLFVSVPQPSHAVVLIVPAIAAVVCGVAAATIGVSAAVNSGDERPVETSESPSSSETTLETASLATSRAVP